MTIQGLQNSGLNQPIKPSPYTKMADIKISTKGIESLRKELNPLNASDLDQLKPIVLQSKKEDKDQESIQSSSTPDPGYHMGK